MISDPKSDTLAAEVKLLTKQHEEARQTSMQINAVQVHVVDLMAPKDVNYMKQRNYQGGQRHGYPADNPPYHPNNRNHLNISWGNPNNDLQSPNYDAPPHAHTPLQTSSLSSNVPLSDMVKQLIITQEKFIGQTGTRITSIEGNITALSKQVYMLEN